MISKETSGFDSRQKTTYKIKYHLGYPSIVKSPDGISYQEAFKKLMTENRHRLTEKEPHYGNLIWTRS